MCVTQRLGACVCTDICSSTQPSVTGDPDSSSVALSPLYLVELSAVTPSGQDSIESEMKAFADHLKPYPCHQNTVSTRFLIMVLNLDL